jgi:glucokinase
LAEFRGVLLAERISGKTGVPAFVDNDVNALALGEWMFGHARGSQSCVVLAIGSGVGAGIILDGRLVRGRNGYAGEFGHVPIDFGGPPCVCGGRGCLYVYVGGNALAGEAQERVTREPSALLTMAGGDARAITAKTIFGAAAAGDPMSRGMVDRACRALGAGLAVIVNGLNPETVIVTGGVVNSLLPLQGDILRRTGEYALAETLAATRIVFAPGDKKHTARGGAALFLYERARRTVRQSARSEGTAAAAPTSMIPSDRG